MASNEQREMQQILVNLANGDEEQRQAIQEAYGDAMLEALDNAASDIQDSGGQEDDLPEDVISREEWEEMSGSEQMEAMKEGKVVKGNPHSGAA